MGVYRGRQPKMDDSKLINQGSEGSPKNFLARRGVLKQLAVIGGAALVLSPQVLAQGVERKKRNGSVRENEQTARDMEALIAEATQFIIVNSDGTLGLLPGSSPTLEAQQLIQGSMAELNPEVHVGGMWINKDLSIGYQGEGGFTANANANGVVYFWWGRRWALDNTTTQRLLYALGAGISIAGYFPGAGRVVAVVLGLGIAVIGWYASPGTGIYIYEPWVGPTWIASQPQ